MFDDKSLEQVTKNRPTVKITESVRKDTDTQTPSSENPVCYVESTVGTDLGLPSIVMSHQKLGQRSLDRCQQLNLINTMAVAHSKLIWPNLIIVPATIWLDCQG